MNEIINHSRQLAREIELGFDLLSQITSDFSDFQVQIIVGLYASCVDLSQSVEFLAQNDKFNEAQIIMRSLLEHFVELKTACEDPEHLKNIQQRHASKIVKTLKHAGEQNPFFEGFAEKLDLDSETAQWSEISADIKGLGGKEEQLRRRFDKAGMLDVYKSVYANLSDLVHPTFAGIIRKYLERDEETKKVHFNFPNPATEGTKVLVYSYTAELMSEATVIFKAKSRL